MSLKLLSKEQKDGIIEANTVLKGVFPEDNIQICLNLSKSHNNVNYNIKASGIEISPKT